MLGEKSDKISPKRWEALIWSSDTTGQNTKVPVVVTWILSEDGVNFFLAAVLQHSSYFGPFSGNGCTNAAENLKMGPK